MSTHTFIGNILVRSGVIDAAGLARAVDASATRPGPIARIVSELGLADESTVSRAIATALHLQYYDAPPSRADATLEALLPADFCRKRNACPLGLDGTRLRVAVSDPLDVALLQDIEFRTGRKIVPVVVTQSWLERALGPAVAESRAASYDKLTRVEATGELEAAEGEYDLVDAATLAKDTNLPPIIRLVNMILSDAAGAGASDIHIEPQESVLQVRQRVDGLLREVLTVPHHLQDQTISRLKIMSGMDIAERRKPQDGRSRLRLQGRRIDLRVSTMPTQFGEKVVIRLLNPDAAILPVEELGFSPDNLRLLKSFLSRPQGMILVTGPTGSGKTSTLYAALKAIKSPTNNIITLEDPIEMQLPGVNQTQVNSKAGVTFASGLRSILRQDPNVILVGEIRDPETASIALQAAQTGHLLFSTLHTNDAPGTVTRLFDLGVQPFVVAASLLGILAQRLVRRVCPSCAVPQAPSAETIERFGGPSRLPTEAAWVAARGCERCGHSGLKGRLALHEVLPIDDDVRAMISSRASEQEIRAAARRAGMRTLLEDGIAKAARGLTTLDEVLRVVSLDSQAETPASKPATMAAPAPAPVPASVPAAPPASAAVPAPSAATAPSAGSANAPDALADAARKRVLVVEDSPTIVSVIKYFLELEGFDVMVAADGRAGLETALAELPDVIVSDVMMPAMTGVEMVRALRADPRAADVRILMLTSEASVETETQGLEAGADDYILKPVEPRRLAARVKKLLGRRRSQAA